MELRFFGGFTEEETAEVLSVSSRTVRRDWRLARAWLFAKLGVLALALKKFWIVIALGIGAVLLRLFKRRAAG